jgi:ribosomal protein L35AE/L33A
VYNASVILIRFPNIDAKRRALAYLAGRFSFKSWATGEMLVPEGALAELAAESIQFSVEGPAKYEQRIPAVRNPSAAAG